jgi:hypothetical protein
VQRNPLTPPSPYLPLVFFQADHTFPFCLPPTGIMLCGA